MTSYWVNLKGLQVVKRAINGITTQIPAGAESFAEFFSNVKMPSGKEKDEGVVEK